MTLRMTRPTLRHDSRQFQFQKRTPKPLLAARSGQSISITFADFQGGTITKLVKVGNVLKFSLATADADEAKARTGAALEQINALTKAIEAGPQRLTQKQVTALAGVAHHRIVARVEDDPGDVGRWQDLRKGIEILISDNPVAELEPDYAAAMAERRDALIGPLVDSLLSEQAMVADAETRARLTDELCRTLRDSFGLIAKRASGDYSPDQIAQRFPKLEASKPGPALSITGLFKAWKAEARNVGKSQGTITECERLVRYFVAFLEHDDARRVTHDDVRRYKDKRLNDDGMSPRTLQHNELVALKSLFKFAMKEYTDFTENPAAKVSVPISRKLKAQSKRNAYSDDGALAILKAARAYGKGPNENACTAAAKQWVPWLGAFSGARAGELAQLRREDITKDRDGHWTMRITPEAGTVKDGIGRTVPLHPQIVDLGFIDYVESVKDGYLFINARTHDEVGGKIQACINRLGEFARGIVREEKVPPNHGWRHRFITLCRRHGVDIEKRRAITGHAQPDVDSSDYGDMAGLYSAVCKLPRYKLE